MEVKYFQLFVVAIFASLVLWEVWAAGGGWFIPTRAPGRPRFFWLLPFSLLLIYDGFEVYLLRSNYEIALRVGALYVAVRFALSRDVVFEIKAVIGKRLDAFKLNWGDIIAIGVVLYYFGVL